MKFSTRSEYGMRAMTILSRSYGQGPVPLRQVAAEEHISVQYLEQIFSDLKKANLIVSVRGANGGYLLAKAPPDINLRELILALEGDINPCDCVKENSTHVCTHDLPCLVQAVWIRLRDGINEILEGITLEDVCQGRVLPAANYEEIIEKRASNAFSVSGLCGDNAARS